MYFSASVLHFNIQTQERKNTKGKLTKRQALTVMGWWATRGAMLKADAILIDSTSPAFPQVPKLVAQKPLPIYFLFSVSTEILFSIQINTNMGGKGKKRTLLLVIPKESLLFQRNAQKLHQHLKAETFNFHKSKSFFGD